MKKVLIPTLRFPPAGGVGLRRIIKMAKNLAQSGVEVHFVTTENGAQVNSYVKDIECQNIYVKKIPSLSLNNYFNKHRDNFFNKVLARCVYYITMPLFFVDYATLWGIVLIPYVVWYAKKNNINNIYASGAAFSTLFHMVIVKLFFLKHINLISEWRDYWTDDYGRKYLPPKYCTRFIQIWMENLVIRHSDRVVSVTPMLVSSLMRCGDKNKFLLIENGFDPDDFHVNNNVSNEVKRINIVYTGNIVDSRSEGLFLFLEFLKQQKINNITFDICGELGYFVKKKMNSVYKDLIDNRIVIYHGVVSVDKAITLIEKSTLALVLVQRQHPEALTSKFFEYCYARKPIIAIGPKGDLQDKMNKINLGIYCELDSFDSEKLNKYICEERKNMEYQFDEIVKHNDFSYLALKLKDELI